MACLSQRVSGHDSPRTSSTLQKRIASVAMPRLSSNPNFSTPTTARISSATSTTWPSLERLSPTKGNHANSCRSCRASESVGNSETRGGASARFAAGAFAPDLHRALAGDALDRESETAIGVRGKETDLVPPWNLSESGPRADPWLSQIPSPLASPHPGRPRIAGCPAYHTQTAL